MKKKKLTRCGRLSRCYAKECCDARSKESNGPTSIALHGVQLWNIPICITYFHIRAFFRLEPNASANVNDRIIRRWRPRFNTHKRAVASVETTETNGIYGVIITELILDGRKKSFFHKSTIEQCLCTSDWSQCRLWSSAAIDSALRREY